jgi:hypothetical protein
VNRLLLDNEIDFDKNEIVLSLRPQKKLSILGGVAQMVRAQDS